MSKQSTTVEEKACPNCGYCPHCGRSNQQPIIYYQYPYWPPQPYYVTQPVTTTTTWANTDGTTTDANVPITYTS